MNSFKKKDKYKILVVDDFEMVRTMLIGILNAIGIKHIEEAHHGILALEKLERSLRMNEPYDLVFSDLNMPEMNGIDLLKKCRENESLKKIPFIMVTSEGEKTTVLQAISLGASDYVVKPFTLEVIEKKVGRFLT